MPLNLKNAVEWVWDHRGNYSRWTIDLLTEKNTSNDSLRLSQSDAIVVFDALLKKRLLVGMGRDGKTLHYVLSDQERDWFAYIAYLTQLDAYRPRIKTESPSPKDDAAPFVTEYNKFAGFHIHKNLPHLKAAWVAVLIIAILGFAAGFTVASKFFVDSKNGTIERLKTDNDSKDHEIKELTEKIQSLKNQASSENQPANNSNLSLKSAVLILGGQLMDLRKRIDAKGNPDLFMMEFENRFEKRIEQIKTRLDEEGINSETLNDLDSGQLASKSFQDRVPMVQESILLSVLD